MTEPQLALFEEEDEQPSKIPTHAVFQKRKVRILYYEDSGYFRVLDRGDVRRTVARNDLIFIRS